MALFDALILRLSAFRISGMRVGLFYRQQTEGGDPVSHCLIPQSAAPVTTWYLASVEVRAS